MKIEQIEINKLKLDKNQPRKTFDEEKLNDMAETFKTQGAIQPIEVDENNVIVTGELRFRASKIAGLKEIPCKVLKGLTSESRLERQLVENFNRQDMKVSDVKEALMRYRKLRPGVSTSEMARLFGLGQQHLSTIIQIEDEAPLVLKKAVDDGKLEITKAREIMKAPKEERNNKGFWK